MLTICQSLTSLPVRSQGVAGGTIAIGINEVVPHLCGADVLIRTTLEVQLLVPILSFYLLRDLGQVTPLCLAFLK